MCALVTGVQTCALPISDIAARGIDVEGITHVINYELPNVPESYVHRIGRTARAGATGMAISFCDAEERAYLRDIERLIRQTVPVVADHPRSEEHTSELQSLMRISYAVFCLKKKIHIQK